MANCLDPVTRHPPAKGNLTQCQNYCIISLISHPSKVMHQVMFNILTSKVEELPVEEQAGFRPGRSTVQQIFNCRVIIEKHLQRKDNYFAELQNIFEYIFNCYFRRVPRTNTDVEWTRDWFR